MVRVMAIIQDIPKLLRCQSLWLLVLQKMTETNQFKLCAQYSGTANTLTQKGLDIDGEVLMNQVYSVSM